MKKGEKAIRSESCLVCGEPVPPQRINSCSDQCRRRRQSQLSKQWERDHPEEIKRFLKRWREGPVRRSWQLKNRDRLAQLQRAMRAKDPHFAAKRRDYESRNRETVRLWKQRSKAKRRSLERGNFTNAEWKLILWLFGFKCAYCEKSGKLTIDHLMPIARGGENIAENLVPACITCNRRKGARLDFEPAKELLFFL